MLLRFGGCGRRGWEAGAGAGTGALRLEDLRLCDLINRIGR